MGTLYGKREHLLRFSPYKVRPAPDALPDRWETGTQVQELIAGIAAAVDYLAELGQRHDPAARSTRVPLCWLPTRLLMRMKGHCSRN